MANAWADARDNDGSDDDDGREEVEQHSNSKGSQTGCPSRCDNLRRIPKGGAHSPRPEGLRCKARWRIDPSITDNIRHALSIVTDIAASSPSVLCCGCILRLKYSLHAIQTNGLLGTTTFSGKSVGSL